MKVGLVRHLEVVAPKRDGLMTSKEFARWAAKYEESGVMLAGAETKYSNWSKCICSSSKRAIETASLLYGKDIIKTDLIREVPIAPVFTAKTRLPSVFWLIAGRIAWLLSHKSQREIYGDTLKRVRLFVAEVLLDKKEDILIVSHGFIMKLISQELAKQKFRGPKIRKAKHGRLYMYTSTSTPI